MLPSKFWFITDCKPGFYGGFCNISCIPGFYGKSCGGICHPICSVEECDPVYGCKLTTGKLLRPTNSGIKWYILLKMMLPYNIIFPIIPLEYKLYKFVYFPQMTVWNRMDYDINKNKYVTWELLIGL